MSFDRIFAACYTLVNSESLYMLASFRQLLNLLHVLPFLTLYLGSLPINLAGCSIKHALVVLHLL